MTHRLVLLLSLFVRSLRLGCLIAIVGTAAAKPVDDMLAPGPASSCAKGSTDKEGFRELAACEARRRGLPPEIASAVMEIESGFNPGARGAAGEIGLMQVMPPTARMLGFRGDDDQLAKPEVNIKLGVQYLAKAHRLAGGDLCTTVMKYRAGHGETRFSARSVDYCLRARKILGRDGFPVAGQVPVATFGLAGAALEGKRGGTAGSGSCTRRILVPGPRYKQCAEYRKVKVRRLHLW